MKKTSYILYLVILISIKSYSQFSPNIHNYNLTEYKAGNQNWDIARAHDGKVFVANNSGLLIHDGLTWKLRQLPNKTTVRSVLSVDDLIFTGSYEEFGYWKKDNYGLLNYYSLSETIKNNISPNEEIWEIVKFKNQIVFRSFLNIYVYDYKKVIKLSSSSTIISCNVIDDKLYICTLKQGVFFLESDKLKLFYFDDSLFDTKIISLTKYEGKFLLLTSLKGSFFLETNRLIPTNFKINEQIRLHQLNEFSVLKNGNMIFGTIKDGIYISDFRGTLKFHISKENGLLNNTILGQFLDYNDDLWLGMDNGISKIDLNSLNYFFNDISGELGSVYDVVEHNGIIYIGSNTGLFRLDKNSRLKFIEGSQGQVWDLKIIEGELFCGHNEGTFLVNGDNIVMISDYTGGWTIKKVPERNHTYVQGTYAGLVKFEKKADKWMVKHLGGISVPSKFLVFENPNTAWVAHAYKGIYKMNFNKSFDTITSIKNYQDKGINSNYNVRVYNIKNNISFKTNNGWQKYEPIIDSIIPYNLLNEKLGKNSYIISEENTNLFALKNNNGFISFKSFSDSNGGLVLNDYFFNNRHVVGSENVSRIKDSIYALNLDNGFMIINSTSNTDISLHEPTIEAISIDNRPIELNKSNEEINFNFNKSITIELSSAKSVNHFFEYKISDTDNKWNKVEGNKVELSNLKDGEYTISFRTSDNLRNVSSIQSIDIDVLPPWYRDKFGFLLYILLAACIVLLFYAMHNKKIAKEQRLIKIKYQREQQKLLREKTLENERHIVQLKNESLQNEIKLKSKQLANNAMALVKKNETLQEIKKELMINKEGFNNYYSFKRLLKKLDNSIVLKDEWEVFENNFSQVHYEFFEILKAKHPILTPKDLKVCAYIKMNLSSKEIAPLMNISVRGVETHRYRLKKKLNIENDISLTDYLLNIK